MSINIHQVPKNGDYDAFEATVWHDEKLQFTLVRKLSGSELATSINRECVRDRKEALEKLREFTTSEAKKLFNSGQYKEGGKYIGDFSPCW